MSDTVDVTTLLSLESETPRTLFGDKQNPAQVLITNGQVLAAENIVVADNYTVATLWVTGGGGFSDFAWGVIYSDVDILVQMKNSLGTAEYTLQTINANVPFYFPYTMRGRTANSLTTTVQTTGLGNVVEIKVQRNVADAVGDATLSMFLFR